MLGLAALKLLQLHAPEAGHRAAALAGGLVGLAFLLDPEAQHFSVAPFTEMPFTLGLVGALAMVALGLAGRRPFVFGLVLGLTGAFRANMLWLAPLFVAAAAWSAPSGRRLRVAALAALGFVLPLAPWWLYKWRAFGDPGWDLTRLVVWDGVEGRTWFSLYHLPETPSVPRGLEAVGLLAAKTARNLPGLVLAALTGPRALWIGALALWCLVARPPRPLLAAALVVLGALALSLVTAAVSIPWLRYVFPARAAAEAAGVLATLALVRRLPALGGGAAAVRAVTAAVAVLALAWGGLLTVRGNDEARRAALERGVPGPLTLLQLGVLMNREIPAGEPVMSNLGPTLAWHARRPVVHLALTPGDVESCRRHLDVRHVLLVFRDASKAWPGWEEVVADPERARRDPELNIRAVRTGRSADGFSIVWLELGDLGPRLAATAR
uniref:Glycosyltransferase RgtA/B/C/D-like domain-containing protein n=1 Tax=Eiseniibacteriota bacterium TaxID=2212470 RepID=A0A832I8J7_UNCEI